VTQWDDQWDEQSVRNRCWADEKKARRLLDRPELQDLLDRAVERVGTIDA
jgi:hypothetical protein